MTDPYDILAVYNKIATANGLEYKAMSKAVHKALVKFGQWCDHQGVDVARYMRARLESVGFKHHVRFEQLQSDRFLVKFREFGEARQAYEFAQDRIATEVVDDTVPDGVQLVVLHETSKQAYADDPDLCRAATDMTGGWHARSRWCRRCPVAEGCRSDAGR